MNLTRSIEPLGQHIACAEGLHDIIVAARLGGARKDAQVDACGAFSAALFDVLTSRDKQCSLVTVSCGYQPGRPEWYHSVVEVNGVHYDSLGLFTEAECRKRMKTHPSVALHFTYTPDQREDCFDAELAELHAFYVKALAKAFDKAAR